jgi:hypothetical protein
MTLTTVAEITKLGLPRHIEDWALKELSETGRAEFAEVAWGIKWLNVRGYKATGATKPVEHLEGVR